MLLVDGSVNLTSFVTDTTLLVLFILQSADFAECIGTLLVWRDVIALKAPLMQ